MSKQTDFLAVDIGASSGRVMLGRWDGTRFALEELHRFPNGPVAVHNHIHWDVLRLWQEIQNGIARYNATHASPPAAIGIDTWAVDFALLDRAGRLLGNPYHYRDRRNEGADKVVDRFVSPTTLYARTGIQRLPFNTIYQLVAMREAGDPQLESAARLLLMSDLFHYWLTGRAVAEYTNATTTQFFDAVQGDWATDLLQQLRLPPAILPPIVPPGTVLGDLLPEVGGLVGSKGALPVVASATHDTASAVAAVPGLDENSAYISSGTWSLVGVETRTPVLTERARLLNFTNEGGVDNTIRFLKNVGGLWLLQETQRQWQSEGHTYSWSDLAAQAEQAPPLRSIVDPDDPVFLNPPNMVTAISDYCRNTGQPSPQTVGPVVRCVLESLALRYRWVVEALEELIGHRLTTIRVVGGGSQNSLLCRFTADATGRDVVAGPVEATALGNILIQAIATGHLPNISAAREAVALSSRLVTYTPQPSPNWEDAFQRFKELVDH